MKLSADLSGKVAGGIRQLVSKIDDHLRQDSAYRSTRNLNYGAVAQLGECLTGSQEVRGSSPLSSTKCKCRIDDSNTSLRSTLLFLGEDKKPHEIRVFRVMIMTRKTLTFIWGRV